MFNLYVDREADYIEIENATDSIYNPITSRLFSYVRFINGKEVGKVIFLLDRWFKGVSVECSIYGRGQWASKDILNHFAEHVFGTMACQRMTCITKKDNKKSIALNKRLGMVKEGVLKRATEDGEPLIIWGLFPDNCKYFKR